MNSRLLLPLLPGLLAALPAGAAPNTTNVAPATYAGSGVIGRSNFPADPGTPTAHVGSPLHLNDEDPATMGTTKAPTGDPLLSQHNSHGGVRWPYLRADYVNSITCTLACFSNGGWFGQPGQFAPPGGLIPGIHLVVPEVQITTNGGTTWTAVPVTSGYLAAISTHLIGADAATPTMVTFTMDLNTPVSGINGIRLAGPCGGDYETAGFLAVTELDVQAGPLADADGDHIDDAWEELYGFLGDFSKTGDFDSDGLVDLEEFRWNTDPTKNDSDEDGLKDGPEVNTHQTVPGKADTDGDGLTDGDEVEIHSTNPLLRDTDGDLFSDGSEIVAATNPLSQTSHPANIARAGTAILGLNDAVDSDDGTPQASNGVTTNVNDGNSSTAVFTNDIDLANQFSFVGVRWDTPYPQPIALLELNLATGPFGGWFGPNRTRPNSGTPLLASHITVPTVQITTDGVTWTDYSAVHTDYSQQATGHVTGHVTGFLDGPATSLKVRFLLATPVSNLRGIRIIGREGGTITNGFLGVYELEVQDTTALPADIDGDGLDATHEANVAGNPAAADTDDDGISDGQEVNGSTSVLFPDTDGDQFSDGLEVARGTNPLNPASRPANIALAGTGLIGRNNAIDDDSGTPYAGFLGSPLYINDENFASFVDTFDGNGGFSYVGIGWDAPFTHPVALLELTLATSSFSGWFSPNNSGPGAGQPLTSAHLSVPTVQITTDGTTWTNYPGTVHTDYLQQFIGHVIGTTSGPTSRTARFLLSTPVSDLRGIRLIGPTSDFRAYFLSVFELRAEESSTLSTDIDGDGLTNAQETTLGTNPVASDTDRDGLSDFAEVFTHQTFPTDSDSDNDGLNDGPEVLLHMTNPLAADTDGDTISDRDEVQGFSNPNNPAHTPTTYVIADSIVEQSGQQGLHNWFYAYRNYATGGFTQNYAPAFTTSGSLRLFRGGSNVTPGTWNGSTQQWDAPSNTWELTLPNTTGQLASSPWTAIGNGGWTHPAGPSSVHTAQQEHWAIRRWVNELTQPCAVGIIWHVRKANTNPQGQGVTGGIWVNGVRKDHASIAATDSTGVFRRVFVNLNPGDVVDLVLTPEGPNGDRQDEADGSRQWMRVDRFIPINPTQPDGSAFLPVAPPDFVAKFISLAPNGDAVIEWGSYPGQQYDVVYSPNSPGMDPIQTALYGTSPAATGYTQQMNITGLNLSRVFLSVRTE